MTPKHKIFILAGPSGSGKDTLLQLVQARCPGLIRLNPSTTTREPRAGEVDGRDYHFVGKEDFLKWASEDRFYEYSEHFGNYYGSLKDDVERLREQSNVVLRIDVNGATQIKAKFPEVILIFLKAPSVEVIHDRLLKRGTEPEDRINMRLARYPYEMSFEKQFDYCILNDDLEAAFNEFVKILQS